MTETSSVALMFSVYKLHTATCLSKKKRKEEEICLEKVSKACGRLRNQWAHLHSPLSFNGFGTFSRRKMTLSLPTK